MGDTLIHAGLWWIRWITLPLLSLLFIVAWVHPRRRSARQLLGELLAEYEREQRNERHQPWSAFHTHFVKRARRLSDPPMEGALLRLLAECTRTLAGYQRDVEGARQTVELLLEARAERDG